MPSSSQSSGWGSSTSRIPSFSKSGSSSSIDFQNWRSHTSAWRGLPLNSLFIVSTPSRDASSIARFQYRTAACRSSSSGPDHL